MALTWKERQRLQESKKKLKELSPSERQQWKENLKNKWTYGRAPWQEVNE